jgi:hypothetical protein
MLRHQALVDPSKVTHQVILQNEFLFTYQVGVNLWEGGGGSHSC